MRQSCPKIEEVYLRSDEAGCYHNSDLISAITNVGERVGIAIKRYDYSEPQHGKDMCDRILCPMKSSIRRYCNEGHDICTAKDMMDALRERPVKGTTASVNTVNVNAKNLEVKKITGFSAYHNVQFEANGVRVWKAYGIGEGKLIPLQELYTIPQGPTLLEVMMDFFPFSSARQVKQSTPGAYKCPEAECTMSFKTMGDLDIHVELGQHKYPSPRLENECLYDKLKRDWVERFSSLTVRESEKRNTSQLKVVDPSSMSEEEPPLPMGWALHHPKSGGRSFPKKVKEYLTAKYDLGEATGNKCNPQQVADDMRSSKLENGERRFSRDEWLTKSQIRGFFSRLTALRRKQTYARETTHDEDALLVEENEASEDHQEYEALRNRLLDEIGLSHPILYDTYNLCEMYKENSLGTFNVKMLKEICEHLEVPIKSRYTKSTIIGMLSDELSQCCCQV